MEEKILCANILGGINSYVRDCIGDDDLTDFWNTEGVPDECDEETLMEIAEDFDTFRDCVIAFARVLECCESNGSKRI